MLTRRDHAIEAIRLLRKAIEHAHAAGAADFGTPGEVSAAPIIAQLAADLLAKAFGIGVGVPVPPPSAGT